MRGILLLAAFAAALIPALLPAQSQPTNPFSSKADFEEGRHLYRLNCGVCHGLEGKSGRGARLALHEHRRGNTDAELFAVIQNGVPGTDMPGLWLDEDEIWKVLLVVRSFEVDAGAACEARPGEAAKGKELYYQKGACSSCHTIGMGGGRLGPDLTAIGSNYDREQLRTALLEPSKDVAARYKAVRVVHRGKSVEGALMKEDGYTLHLMDREENLHSFSKSELETIEKPEESLMPAYGSLISGSDLDDLLAYMCTLTGNASEEPSE